MRVIDQEQRQLGVITTAKALDLARDAGLDLVEVSPMEEPPVCRIMDYGKYNYERKKRQKLASHGHTITLKEIRLRPKTDTHDLEIKMKRTVEFLEEGHKVQFTMLFRGRERFHKERGLESFDLILSQLGESVKVEQRPIMAGRRMTMVVSPVKAPAQKGGGGSGAAAKTAGPPRKAPPRQAPPSSAPPVGDSAPSSEPPVVEAAPQGAPRTVEPAPSAQEAPAE